MMKLQASCATTVLHKWRHGVAELRLCRDITINKALRRMSHRDMWAYWSQWCTYVREERKAAKLKETEGIHLAQLEDLKRAHTLKLEKMSRLKEEKLRASELSAKDYRVRMNRKRATLLREFVKWRFHLTKKFGKRRTLMLWHRMAERAAVRKRNLLRTTLLRLTQARKYQGFRALKNHVLRMKTDEMLKGHSEHAIMLAKQMLSRMENQKLATFYGSWKALAGHARRERQRRLQATLYKMDHADKWHSWRKWRAYVLHQRLEDEKEKFAWSRLNNEEKMGRLYGLGLKFKLLTQWGSFVAKRKLQKESLLMNILQRKWMNNKWAAWHKWASSVEKAKIRDILRKMTVDMQEIRAKVVALQNSHF